MSKDDESRLMAVELAKRLLVDAIWKTASIEVDGISFRDTQEIFEGRALLMFCKITRGQWFNDGNERTALMTANHALINAGVGVFSIRPSLKREFTTRLLRYYESNDDVPFHSWLKDNAIGRLPGGITSAESRRLELKRSRAAGPNCASPSSASAVTP